MREIKFRGKSIQDGSWVYGHLAHLDNHSAVIATKQGGIQVWRESVGQYTGLKDKNGVEIYEGDIVRINHPEDMTGDFTNKLGRVFWWDEEGGWYHGHESVKDGSGRPPKRMWPYTEIIGNIYENPELLEQPQ